VTARFDSLAAALGALLVVGLLVARSLLVPPFAFLERQWSARDAGGAPLRETRTRWARVISVIDGTLVRPGGLVVEWRGFLAVDRAGTIGIVVESAGPASVAIDGRDVVRIRGAAESRGQGLAEVAAGAREIVVRVAVPELRAAFRGALRLPDGRAVPLERAEVTVEPRSPESMRIARAHRAWADPLLALAGAITAIGIASALRGRRAAARLVAEISATAVLLAVALFAPHGSGLDAWGTWAFGGVSPVPRVLVLLAGLAPWALVRARRPPALPGALRSPAALAVIAFALFWFLRERRFWGDSWITIAVLEGRFSVDPFGSFFWKEPLDRLIAVLAASGARALGADTASAIAATSCLAGALAVASLAWHARRDGGDGSATAAFALTAGAALVFFGHVENYSWVSAAILAFLPFAERAARGEAPPLFAGALGGLAVSFHPIATFVVAPALLATSIARRSVSSALALFAGAALPVAILLVACIGAGIVPPSIGWNRFADDPAVVLSFADAFAPRNLALVAQRMALLLSPGIALGLLAGIGRPVSRDALPIAAASLGSLACFAFFHGKIRPEVQDWDLYAPAAFPLALLAARGLRGAEAVSTRAWCIGVSAAVLLLGVFANR
jgi:hypothetical protein